MCPPVMSGGILSSLWRVVGGQRRETGAPNTPRHLNGVDPSTKDLALDKKNSDVTTAGASTGNDASSRQVSHPVPVVYSGGARKKVLLPRYYHRGDPTDSEGSSSSGPCSPVFPRRGDHNGAALRYRGTRGTTMAAEGRRWTSNGNSSSNNNIVSSSSWGTASGVGAAVVLAGKGLGGSVTTQCARSSLGATSGSPPPSHAQGRLMDKASRHKDAAIIRNISRMSNQHESLVSHPPDPPPLPPTIIGAAVPATSASKPGGGNAMGYLEYIRAFDIYTIHRRPSDAPYPPTLPALASQTTDDDTDSDDSYRGRRRRGRGCGCVGNSSCVVCDNETLTGKKKIVPRKRKNLDANEVARRKKWRDKDSGEEDNICPNIHRGSNIPRPGPSSDFIQAHTLETNMFMSPIAMQKSQPSTAPHQKIFGGRVVCDVDDDAPSSDDTLSDDDDETSTVVPDDFETDGGGGGSGGTDSDIEVLQEHESWVDLSTSTDPLMASTSKAGPKSPTSPDRVAPLPFGNGEEYLRLLREAQKESNHSSARVSLASSRKETPRDSPKSPPNSPNTEMATENTEEAILRGVYINYYNKEQPEYCFSLPTWTSTEEVVGEKEGDFIRVEKNTETDWIWDWSSRPDQTPPKEWRFSHPRKGVSRGASIRRVMVGNSSLFSRDVLYTLLITNVLSLILGTGIGMWLSKRSGGASLSTLPIN